MKKQPRPLKSLWRRRAKQVLCKLSISMSSSVMFERRTVSNFPYRSSILKVGNAGMLLSGNRAEALSLSGIAALEKLMREFSIHHRGAVSSPPGFVPKGGDLVSAKFSDGAWYRAKIRRASPVKKEAEVTFIDYGNQDTVSFSNIRPLDAQFRSLPGQAQDARLRFVACDH